MYGERLNQRLESGEKTMTPNSPLGCLRSSTTVPSIAAVPLARRVLEKRFRAVLGRTLREEITRVQMQRVKDLLVATDLPLTEIAERAGYRHSEYLTVVFKREVGQPPSVYRREHRAVRS